MIFLMLRCVNFLTYNYHTYNKFEISTSGVSCPTFMTSSTLPPVAQELAELRKNKLEWCDIQPADDDIMRWTAMLVGPVRHRRRQETAL